MSSLNENLKAFAIRLYEINAIKFGEFKTKVGLMTPVYCDLRVIVSYPDVMVRLDYYFSLLFTKNSPLFIESLGRASCATNQRH